MGETRILPEPYRYAVCAEAGMPIKEFYKGEFEEVYIFFHPFIKPVTIDYELFNPDTYPLRRSVLEHCREVTWNEFMIKSGLSSTSEVDIGLRTIICGLNKKYENKAYANLILEACEDHKIVYPAEGLFPDHSVNDLLAALQQEGYEWIWCGDEFCTRRKLEYIEDCREDNGTILDRECRNLFTHDHKILITTHWDSHFSMICGEKDTIKRMVEASNLEGFFCDEKTEIHWSLQN
ncbi:DUF2711 family protein [Bacillus sp. KH172YL63]|uniref:DUF2711 family protein n=1 Tax=Bacillus sp. KH172YL63 TaxID=2709784 RepID=UPI0013E4A1BC|nr:DUF2711 family protein [Bacillus sp. KH172YL63]BCB04170.1 hypothetical protein KH172YL63_23030 [Bacillus sp. KH172YL63]